MPSISTPWGADAFCALVLAGAAAAFPAGAAEAPQATAQPAALTDRDLAEQRGGLATPFGYDIDFGAVVRTFVDGQLVLQTRLTWTPQGPSQTVEAGRPTPDLAGQAAARGIDLSGLKDVKGVVVDGQGGATVALQQLGPGRLAGLVVNTASNRDIRQDTSIDLGISDFSRLQKDFAAASLAAKLQDSLGQALQAATAR